MKEKAFTLDRGKRYLFYILMIAILGWFLFMQFFGADERSQEMSSGPVIYSGTFIWQKSDGTFVSPEEFIPLFESSGFITRFDMYIWKSVCKTLAAWQDILH